MYVYIVCLYTMCLCGICMHVYECVYIVYMCIYSLCMYVAYRADGIGVHLCVCMYVCRICLCVCIVALQHRQVIGKMV